MKLTKDDPRCEHCTTRPSSFVNGRLWDSWASQRCMRCREERGNHAFCHPHPYFAYTAEKTCQGFVPEIPLEEVIDGLWVMVSDFS